MRTVIENIGSKFAGEPSDSLIELEAMLAREPLCPRFEEYGNFIYLPDQAEVGSEREGMTHCWGNFSKWSYAFDIWTDDPAVIARLTKAIRDNQATDAYGAAKVETAERETMWQSQNAARRRQREQHARMQIAEGRKVLARIQKGGV